MSVQTTTPFLQYDPARRALVCSGEWVSATLTEIVSAFQKCSSELEPDARPVTLDASAITRLDTSGAQLLKRQMASLHARSILVTLSALPPDEQRLYDFIAAMPTEKSSSQRRAAENVLVRIGKFSVGFFFEARLMLNFLGQFVCLFCQALRSPRRIPWCNVAYTIETTGVNALPIIGLLSFLIGMVLAYQMGAQLKNYGANIFIVDVLGISIFSEFAPLMTAVILAGRTGAAFTAEIGTMKIREELDALWTMGCSPAQFVVLPKLLAMFIVVPLLTIWADVFAMMGGMVMSRGLLHLSASDFIARAQTALSSEWLSIGLSKTFVYAAIIVIVSCFQGMQVEGGASGVGKHTTRSVVQILFLIIIADALFSLVFSWLGIY